MLVILVVGEFFGCCLALSAIAWLRHFYGAPPLARDWVARYGVPFLSAMAIALGTYLSIQNRTTIQQLDMHPPDVRLPLVLGIALAAFVVWLMVEVGRYRTHRRGVSRSNQSYSHNPSSQRRPKRGRSKNRTR